MNWLLYVNLMELLMLQPVLKQLIKSRYNMIVTIALFIVSIMLFWINWFVIQYSWISYNDILFCILEILFLIILLVMIVCAIVSVVMILRKDTKIQNKVVLLIFLIAVVLIHLLFGFLLVNTGEQITVLISISSKEIISDEYCIVINNVNNNEAITIKCDEKTYNDIIVDENILYTIEYRLDLFDKTTGSLYSIDIDDYIENDSIQ